MAIKAGRFIVDGNDITPQPKYEQPKVVEMNRPIKSQIEAAATNEHPVLIVNGKEKKVSKRSAYMLDMLTLDDE